MSGIGNIQFAWDLVDDIDLAEGLSAYSRYQQTMKSLAAFYGCTLAETTAGFCALSPNNDYVGNLRSLVTLMKGKRDGVPVDRLTVSTYNACRDRAWRFLHGEDFLLVTKGPKTRSFYKNILDPSDPHPVTIDGHMLSLYQGERMTMVEAARLRFKYDDVAGDFRRFAFKVALVPCQVQAVLWFTWKRVHNVVYDGQLKLFSDGDQWGLVVDPEKVKPFPVKVA